MTKASLVEEIHSKQSFLCVGLDSDLQKIPKYLLDFDDPIYEFNKRIIDATKDHCVAYKPNIAFYESMGAKGWESLQKTIDYIPNNILKIADAKRGDIGNTSRMYAKAFFEHMNFDAVTVAPYMGSDSVEPFLEFDNKWVILLALTSNKGSFDFQRIHSDSKKPLFESVIQKSKTWGTAENLMYVVGATRADDLKHIRSLIPDHFLLVPGIGAQGGSMEAVIENGQQNGRDIGLLVNSSRGVIYAGADESFAIASANQCKVLTSQMSKAF